MKTALLGGTFDPIHFGHLYIAREASRILSLEQVRFLVAGIHPLKNHLEFSAARHRLAMTRLALENEKSFTVSDEELRRQGTAYTIDTMNYAARELGKENICFIAGSDILKEIHVWKDSSRLLEEYCLFFVQRPGDQVNPDQLGLKPEIRQRIRIVDENSSPRIQPGVSWLATLNSPGISSSELREKIRLREPDLEQFLPGNVLNYILENRLYERSYGNTKKS